MQYRTLGNMGLSVSIIGFGASPLENVFSLTPRDRDNDTARVAVDAGIILFDVSPYYGLGFAEERIGQALRPFRQIVILATKFGRYGVDDFDFSPRTIRTRLEQSLRCLQTDAVDVLQMHDIEFGNIEQIVGETLPDLLEPQ